MTSQVAPRALPIIVGITGHRDLRSEELPELEKAIAATLDDLADRYPSMPLLVLTPLAEGADRLLARLAVARGIPYRVPLPMPAEQYREDFDEAGKIEFDELLRGAAGTYRMPFFADNNAQNVIEPARRAHQYALVGAHLAQASHVFIALWDGENSTAVGGTAMIVRFRCFGVPSRYLERASVLDAPETGTVYHIFATRRSSPPARVPAGRLRRLIRGSTPTVEDPYPLRQMNEDEADPFEPLYRRLAAFNADCALVSPRVQEAASATERLIQVAEAVSTHFQQKSRLALNALFLCTAVAATVLAVYSHLARTSHWLVFPYAFFLSFAVGIYFVARLRRLQDRAQDYRALEIGLSVQRVWDLAGLGRSVADYYVRRQRTELDWIRAAIRTVHNIDRVDDVDEAHAIEAVRTFVHGQLRYFGEAARREQVLADRFRSVENWALLATFAFSFCLIIFGIWLLSGAESRFSDQEKAYWHARLIFSISITTIVAVLFHEYPRRRAFRQQARRYTAMQAIYQRASEALDDVDRGTDVARQVIFDIGAEALAENGDWLLLHRELPIELIRV